MTIIFGLIGLMPCEPPIPSSEANAISEFVATASAQSDVPLSKFDPETAEKDLPTIVLAIQSENKTDFEWAMKRIKELQIRLDSSIFWRKLSISSWTEFETLFFGSSTNPKDRGPAANALLQENLLFVAENASEPYSSGKAFELAASRYPTILPLETFLETGLALILNGHSFAASKAETFLKEKSIPKPVLEKEFKKLIRNPPSPAPQDWKKRVLNLAYVTGILPKEFTPDRFETDFAALKLYAKETVEPSDFNTLSEIYPQFSNPTYAPLLNEITASIKKLGWKQILASLLDYHGEIPEDLLNDLISVRDRNPVSMDEYLVMSKARFKEDINRSPTPQSRFLSPESFFDVLAIHRGLKLKISSETDPERREELLKANRLLLYSPQEVPLSLGLTDEEKEALSLLRYDVKLNLEPEYQKLSERLNSDPEILPKLLAAGFTPDRIMRLLYFLSAENRIKLTQYAVEASDDKLLRLLFPNEKLRDKQLITAAYLQHPNDPQIEKIGKPLLDSLDFIDFSHPQSYEEAKFLGRALNRRIQDGTANDVLNELFSSYFYGRIEGNAVTTIDEVRTSVPELYYKMLADHVLALSPAERDPYARRFLRYAIFRDRKEDPKNSIELTELSEKFHKLARDTKEPDAKATYLMLSLELDPGNWDALYDLLGLEIYARWKIERLKSHKESLAKNDYYDYNTEIAAKRRDLTFQQDSLESALMIINFWSGTIDPVANRLAEEIVERITNGKINNPLLRDLQFSRLSDAINLVVDKKLAQSDLPEVKRQILLTAKKQWGVVRP